jgi:hypothetical protein
MSKIIVNKKVIVEEVIIPKEHTESLYLILKEYDKVISKSINEGSSINIHRAVTFARETLRKMDGEEA